MKIETKNVLVIELEDEKNENFKSGLKKLMDEQKQAGFKKSTLKEEEINVMNEILEKL